MADNLALLVGGVWVSDIGLWGDLTIEHTWPGGCGEITFGMTLKSRKRPPSFTLGAPVEVRLGPRPICSGNLTEPDWLNGQFVAEGPARQGDTVPCLTPGGVIASVPDVAIDNAITKGWVSWQRTASISNTPYAPTDDGTGTIDATDTVNPLSTLLDAYTLENNRRWGVDPYRRVYTAADPTTPSWDIYPDTQVMGVSSEKLVGTLMARWADASGNLHTTQYGTGSPVVTVSFENLGGITLTRMNTIGASVLARSAQILGATNPITITQGQISSGGVHPSLALVTAGQMVRLLGQRDPRGLDANTSMVVGRSLWTTSGDQAGLALEPVDASTRDLATIVSKLGGEVVS